jgi:hypothetical protein
VGRGDGGRGDLEAARQLTDVGELVRGQPRPPQQAEPEVAAVRSLRTWQEESSAAGDGVTE